jgi:hypothetical protein
LSTSDWVEMGTEGSSVSVLGLIARRARGVGVRVLAIVLWKVWGWLVGVDGGNVRMGLRYLEVSELVGSCRHD